MKVSPRGVGVLTTTEVFDKTFRVTLRAYAREEVDEFLEHVAETLWEWERGNRGKLTPHDVEQQKFRVALRGYSMDEVDRFLDDVAATLRHYDPGPEPVLDARRPRKASIVGEQPYLVALRDNAEEEFDGFLGRVAEAVRDFEERLAPELTVPASVAPGSGLVDPAKRTEVDSPTSPGDEDPTVDPTVPISAASTKPSATAVPPTPPPSATVQPTPTVTRLIVTRTSERGSRPYTVLLNDKSLGKLRPGATQRFEIPTGMHWVTVKARKDQSNAQVIEPHEGDQITMTCGPASGDQIDELGRRMEGIILEMAE